MISLALFNKITAEDSIDLYKRIMRKNMVLVDVIFSYPLLKEHIEKLMSERFESKRTRYYPFLMSEICGKKKYSPNAFYMGVSDEIEQEFEQWKLDLKNYIIDNEHLHEYWIL